MKKMSILKCFIDPIKKPFKLKKLLKNFQKEIKIVPIKKIAFTKLILFQGKLTMANTHY